MYALTYKTSAYDRFIRIFRDDYQVQAPKLTENTDKIAGRTDFIRISFEQST